MKTMQKLVSVLVVLALILSLSLGAFAADDTEHKITVKNPDAAETHEYTAYQVMTGIYSEPNVLTDVKWGNGVNGEALLQDLIVNVPAFGACTDAISVAKVLEGFSDNSDELREFAYYVNKNLAQSCDVATGDAENDAVLTVPCDGYYFVKDTTEELLSDTYSDYMLFVEGNVEIEAKDTTGVESYKKVMDINDSNLEGSPWQDSADYDIGDDVPFLLYGKVAEDLDKYETYKFIFHDKQCDGLTFKPETVVVKVDGTPISTGYTVVTENLTDGCTFEIQIDDVKTLTDNVHGGSEITVEYYSTLNENAVIGVPGWDPENGVTHYGNENDMRLEYSNNPTASGTGTEHETGYTPWDEVIVYTYEVEIDKVNENGEPLVGADFELYKWYLNEDVDPATFTTDMIGDSQYGEWRLVPGGAEETTGPTGDGDIITINGKSVARFTGPDGKEYFKFRDKPNETSAECDIYLLVEEVEEIAPAIAAGRSRGVSYYDLVDGQMVEVSGNFSYMVRSIERKDTGGATHFSWVGVDDGWYKLVETQVPKDYNPIEPIIFEIIAEHTPEADIPSMISCIGYVDGEPYFMPLEDNIGILHAEIENHSGAHMPSTGGWALWLYILGGLLVVGAGALLVVKKYSDAN